MRGVLAKETGIDLGRVDFREDGTLLKPDFCFCSLVADYLNNFSNLEAREELWMFAEWLEIILEVCDGNESRNPEAFGSLIYNYLDKYREKKRVSDGNFSEC